MFSYSSNFKMHVWVRCVAALCMVVFGVLCIAQQAVDKSAFESVSFDEQNALVAQDVGRSEVRQSQAGFGRRSGDVRTSDRSSYPTWEVDPGFKQDVFTFARVQYDSLGYVSAGRSWANDFPDCDWNFSSRLEQLTSLEVAHDGVVIRLTDPDLFDYPFIFMSNVNRLSLSEAERVALRTYLLNGGFLMADDFWAPAGWQNVYAQMKTVFPDREPIELTADHEIFHMVYELQGTPQVPSIRAWVRGETFEYWHGDPQGDEDPHFWAFVDDHERVMALLCHNNDIGDGWEREGENQEYFEEYSVRVSYPLGINIVTYALTH